jgi:hypothetical protein
MPLDHARISVAKNRDNRVKIDQQRPKCLKGGLFGSDLTKIG